MFFRTEIKNKVLDEASKVKKKKKQKETPERLARTLFLGNVSTSVGRKVSFTMIFMRISSLLKFNFVTA